MGNVGAILGQLWEVLGVLGSTLELRVYSLGFKLWGLRFDHHNAYLIEMPKSLSTYTCAAKTFAWKTKMLSSIEITYLMEMHTSVSNYSCAAKTLA